MSRPPINRPAPSPRDGARYFGPDFQALVELAEGVARDAHGIEIPAKGRGLARTLVELPALIAHILGEHQSLYSREASLSSARLAASLTRHARRLAHEPGPGVAATGLAAFTVKPGLSGELARGFALQTSPAGDTKAQTFETLAAARVDAEWNAIRPADALVPDPVMTERGHLVLRLARNHGLAKDDIVVLQSRRRTGVFRVADPMPTSDPPQIGLHNIGGHGFADKGSAADWNNGGYTILARPRHDLRLFGWNAPAAIWPPDALSTARDFVAPPVTATPGTLAFGYRLDVPAGDRLLLAEPLRNPPSPTEPAVVLFPRRADIYAIREIGETMVSFLRGEAVSEPRVTTPTDARGQTTVSVTTQTAIARTELSARVSTLALDSLTGTARSWSNFPMDAHVLCGWTTRISPLPTIPETAALDPEFEVLADLSAMRPGRPAILRRLSTGEAREAVFAAIRPPADGSPRWSVRIEVAGGFPADWAVGDVEVLGNVIRVSHGEATQEILGHSDGVSAHQEFILRSAPVTRLPGAVGSDIALEVRVDGVLWDPARDFHDQGPDARIWQAETDADGRVTVRFGGEGRGAIPPSGRRNVTAEYRKGLGASGNTGAGRLNRIRKASALIDSVTNPLAITGGADPATADDIARQAVRPVMVFDRAVSVQDHADLALLFPGIARASARWRDGTGIELVAADADGNGPADPTGFAAFLDRRRDTGIPLSVTAPQAVDVVLGLRVERDPAWLAEATRLGVEESLLGDHGLFTFSGRELSAPQSLSGIYARLLDLPGVAGVLARRYGLAPGGATVADIIHAGTRQWLRLSPASLEIRMVEPGALDRHTGGTP